MSDWKYELDDGLIAFYEDGIQRSVDKVFDALNTAEKRIAELVAENERLQDAWFIDETICPDGSLRPKVSTLLNRIAELEAVGDALALSAQTVTDILPLEIASEHYIAELVYKIHDWVNATRKESEE